MPNLMEVMRHEVKAVPHTSPISEAAQQMKIWRVSALLVKHNHDFVGIITDTDIVRKGVAETNDLSGITVASIMTTPFITIDSQHSPREAQQMMADSDVRHLVVRQGQAITGIVSMRDLLVFSQHAGEAKYAEPKIGVD